MVIRYLEATVLPQECLFAWLQLLDNSHLHVPLPILWAFVKGCADKHIWCLQRPLTALWKCKEVLSILPLLLFAGLVRPVIPLLPVEHCGSKGLQGFLLTSYTWLWRIESVYDIAVDNSNESMEVEQGWQLSAWKFYHNSGSVICDIMLDVHG